MVSTSSIYNMLVCRGDHGPPSEATLGRVEQLLKCSVIRIPSRKLGCESNHASAFRAIDLENNEDVLVQNT